MVSQKSNTQESGSFDRTSAHAGNKMPSDSSKQNTIPSDQRVEPDYFTKGGVVKPPLPTAANNQTEIPRSTGGRDMASGSASANSSRSHQGQPTAIPPKDSRDTQYQKPNRNELDRFVGENDLKARAESGKLGIQQFFGIESSY